MARKRLDLQGQRFGRLTVTAPAEDVRLSTGESKVRWLCRCKCGRELTVSRNDLVSGRTVSCPDCAKAKRQRRNPTVVLKPSDGVQEIHQNPSDPFQDLANAIVATAVDDYRAALKAKNERMLESIETFFYSGWFKTLTTLDPRELVTRLRAERKRGRPRKHKRAA